jgi:hypothetical protein
MLMQSADGIIKAKVHEAIDVGHELKHVRTSLHELHTEQAAMRAIMEGLGQQLKALSARLCGSDDARGSESGVPAIECSNS